MEKNTVIVIALAVLILVSVVQAVQISNIKGGVTGNAVAASSGNLDTTGWTADEIMNYEMHGTIPARVQGQVVRAVSSAPSQSAMVGGC